MTLDDFLPVVEVPNEVERLFERLTVEELLLAEKEGADRETIEVGPVRPRSLRYQISDRVVAPPTKRRCVSRAFREAIRLRDQGRCGLCGEPIEDERHPHPHSESFDHVVPVAAGGAHTIANLQLAHLSCNIRAGAKQAGRKAQ